MIEPLVLGDSDAFLAKYEIKPEGDGFSAQGDIYAAFSRGDEMMRLIAVEITQKATELGGPITHTFVATTDRALALVQRTGGYEFIGKDHKGNPMYRKTFFP